MYTFNKILADTTFDDAIAHTRQALADKGFGILTEVDVQKTMKTKLDETMPGYVILGACNPKMAFEALKLEPRVGAMLPCNVIVRDLGDGSVEVSAIDPVASMSAIDNAELHNVASQVRQMLSDVVAAL
ncbi:MAG: DUF302 domain-containing protein [Devosia sp.]